MFKAGNWKVADLNSIKDQTLSNIRNNVDNNVVRVVVLKGIIHPKMKPLSLIIHPHVIPNL